MTRAQQLKDLALTVKNSCDAINEDVSIDKEESEQKQWDIISNAVVKAFDILMGK